MVFHVEITDSALRDAEDFVRFIRDVRLEPAGVELWWNGFVDHVLSLESEPLRCALVPECALAKRGVRQLLYHSHRIVFLVDSAALIVRILRVYHGSRRGLRGSDV